MSSVKGSDPPAFQSRDPRTPEFWDERFASGFTPWDEDGTPTALVNWLSANPPPHGTRVFVPGAGSAHELSAFAAAGCLPLGLDISEVAVQRAKQTLGAHARFVTLGNALALAPPQPFDWLYERAFLCALPPGLHAQWSAMAQRLVKPNGLLLGFFFLRDEASIKGLPFAITANMLDKLLGPSFVCETDEPYETGLAAFAGGVRWQVWRKAAT